MSRGLSHTITVVAAALVMSAALAAVADAHPEGPPHHAPLPPHANEVMRAFAADTQSASVGTPVTGGAVTCTEGFAGDFPCSNVDLLSYLPLSHIGGTRSNSAANDIWGWTDPTTGKEYAIIGRVFGTSFVDISDPENPVYLGELPTHGAFGSSWRDIKVYKNHAFIVSEALNHGMQVFDLTQLRDVASPPVTFGETAHYSGNAAAHNIAINEGSGFAYIVGASGKNSCSGGLHMVNIQNPINPSFAGCYSGDGYTHDVQCVIYTGPDSRHQNREICLASNEDTVTVVDVTDKSNPVMLSRTGYAGAGYTHQGWLTDDQSHFLLDDELDEQDFGHGTRTRVFDVSDLNAPQLVTTYTNTGVPAIDHNQYVMGSYSFQANYRAGLRILDISTLSTLSEVAYFDVYPADDDAEFNGAWSNYPYFASGVVIVSGIEQGLFVLKPTNLTDGGGGGAGSPPTVSITSPTDGATFQSGTSIAFEGTASDTEDGDLTDSLEWTSDLDGPIGTGGSFSATLSDGQHVVTSSVTDPDGNTGSDSVTITVGDSSSGGITLSAIGYKIQGLQKADLEWSGATSTHVDVYRNGALITTTANDGFHTDDINNRGSGSYTYKVCEAGTSTCSNEATVQF